MTFSLSKSNTEVQWKYGKWTMEYIKIVSLLEWTQCVQTLEWKCYLAVLTLQTLLEGKKFCTYHFTHEFDVNVINATYMLL